MKKIIIAIVSVLVITAACMSFVGCKPTKVNIDGIKGFGEQKPTETPVAAFSGDMSAIEMLEVGVKNYYGASYIASNSEGALNTQVMGLNFTQFVKSQTIRQGSSNGDYKQFSNNISGSVGSSLKKLRSKRTAALCLSTSAMLTKTILKSESLTVTNTSSSSARTDSTL